MGTVPSFTARYGDSPHFYRWVVWTVPTFTVTHFFLLRVLGGVEINHVGLELPVPADFFEKF